MWLAATSDGPWSSCWFLGLGSNSWKQTLTAKKALFRHEDLALFRIAGEITAKNGSNSPTNPFKLP
jgi:hypothetical protein